MGHCIHTMLTLIHTQTEHRECKISLNVKRQKRSAVSVEKLRA